MSETIWKVNPDIVKIGDEIINRYFKNLNSSDCYYIIGMLANYTYEKYTYEKRER